MKEDTAYIYGRNSVIEALRAGKEIEKIFIAYGTKGEAISSIFSLAKRNKVAAVSYDKRKHQVLERKVCPRGANSQGVIALLSQIHLLSVDDIAQNAFDKNEYPILIVLDEINDPHNLGAIARSGECCGASGIIVTERNSAPLSPVAIKASAGGLEYIPMAKTSSLIATLKDLKNYGFWVIGTDHNAENIYTEDLYDRPIAIVIGSEGKGIRPSTRKHCDLIVSIPMKGNINSLNASVSAGVILFEIVRQRNVIS